MIELLRTRRSIRKYTSQEIDSTTIDLLKEALLRSPSSRGFNPWEFIFVSDTVKLQQLSLCKKSGSSFVKKAPLAVIICGDTLRTDVWVEDCSVASIILQFTAHSLGLGSCWVQIRNRQTAKGESSDDYIKKLFGIPSHLTVESVISIGYPDETPENTIISDSEFLKIHTNGY
jgi:nitroreductase